MTVDVDSEIGVETLVISNGEFPSLVLELAHVEHRVRTEGDTLIGRNQSGGTVQTVVHPLLEDVEADGELVAQAEVDSEVGLLDLLRFEAGVSVDGLVGVVPEPGDVSTLDGGYLVLVVVTAVAGVVISGDGVGSAELQEGEPRGVLLDEGFVGSDPCCTDCRGPDPTGLGREVVRSGVTGGKVQ